MGAGTAWHNKNQSRMEVQGVAAMVLKAAVVFIAGGLTGSGIVALTNAIDRSQPPTATATIAAPAAGEIHAPWVDSSLPADQTSYIHAHFAAQRPFAALYSPRR